MTHSRKNVKLFRSCLLCLALVLLFVQGLQPNAQAQPGTPELQQADNNPQTGSAGKAWGSVNGPFASWAWPFVFTQMGHVISSYQRYGDLSEAYFHHGIDILANDGTPVRTPCAGQVVNVENYVSGNSLYWEVAILDAQGYVWQYHHLDYSSIPQAIHQAYVAYQANPSTGGFVPANSLLGSIVFWPEVSFGYRFNHIHLNILAAGDVYLNPLDFFIDDDQQAPVIHELGLYIGSNTLITGNTIPAGTNYSLYAKVSDLYRSQVYSLPPNRVEYSLDGGPWELVWDFNTLPGGSSATSFVNNYYLPDRTMGDYENRVFYINLGFSTGGQKQFPQTPGEHKLKLRVWDHAYNQSQSLFNWIITEAIPDTGCTGGNGLVRQIVVSPENGVWIDDLKLGLVLSHRKRGEIRLSLQGPQDSAPVLLIASPTDSFANYSLVLDDSSTLPINDGNDDRTSAPYYVRTAGPLTDGTLDHYRGQRSTGTWTVRICDATPQNNSNGQLYLLDLRISGQANMRPIAQSVVLQSLPGKNLPIKLEAWDADGDSLSWTLLSQTQHGQLSGTAPNLIYKPDRGFVGTDSFSFEVHDGHQSSEVALVSIIIKELQLFIPMIMRP